jgi:hypothetical protein
MVVFFLRLFVVHQNLKNALIYANIIFAQDFEEKYQRPALNYSISKGVAHCIFFNLWTVPKGEGYREVIVSLSCKFFFETGLYFIYFPDGLHAKSYKDILQRNKKIFFVSLTRKK